MNKNNLIKIIANNKRVKHDYFIEAYYEAGIVLLGTEVKSLRMGKSNIRDSYAKIKNGEVFLYRVYIAPYLFGNRENHEPERVKKLLLHKNEIRKLYSKINEKGYTLVPMKIYFYNGRVKVGLGVAKGKRKYDKREIIRQRDQNRDLDRERKSIN